MYNVNTQESLTVLRVLLLVSHSTELVLATLCQVHHQENREIPTVFVQMDLQNQYSIYLILYHLLQSHHQKKSTTNITTDGNCH